MAEKKTIGLGVMASQELEAKEVQLPVAVDKQNEELKMWANVVADSPKRTTRIRKCPKRLIEELPSQLTGKNITKSCDK